MSGTQDNTPRSAAEKARRCKVQRQLDEALADSSPASDPVSLVTSQSEEWEQDGAAEAAPAGPAPPQP